MLADYARSNAGLHNCGREWCPRPEPEEQIHANPPSEAQLRERDRDDRALHRPRRCRVAPGLPKKRRGPQQLKPGAVTTKALHRKAVTAGKIAPKAVTAGKLGANAVLPG